MRLTPETQSAGYRLLSRDATESTNDDAIAAARAGDPGHLWIVAAEQLSGRGRQGRPWSSVRGNLYASLLLIDPCPQASAPQLGFVTGVALHEAVESVLGIGAPRLALKWPNDLLLDGAKMSGMLLEAHRVGRDQSLAVVIGIGINVAASTTGAPYPTTSLQTLKPDLRIETLFAALSDSFARTFAAWRQAAQTTPSDSFAAIRRLWLERAAGIGKPVTVRLPSEEKHGTFEGLDAVGRLQLRRDTGLELIDAGDLFFPNLIYDNAGLSPARQGSDQ